jgi:hypothetical protein
MFLRAVMPAMTSKTAMALNKRMYHTPAQHHGDSGREIIRIG